MKADPGQIEQVIMNLVVNARDAMPQGGRLTIETANVDLDESYGRTHAEVEPGRYVLLAVSDTGCGMTEEVKAAHLRAVLHHQGGRQGDRAGPGDRVRHRQAERRPRRGLQRGRAGHDVQGLPPLGRGRSSRRPAEAAPAGPDRARETILLVEDEEAVRALTRLALQANGYTVLEAADGEEAIRLCERHAGPIHLLVTDVVMPHMGGRQLAERLTALHPEMRVLFVSGYTDDAVVRHGVLQAEVAFLQKPFTVDALHRKVRAVLDAVVPSENIIMAAGSALPDNPHFSLG